MFLVVGLGNPGPGYAKNRHNIGFMAVDEVVRRHGFGPWRRRFQGELAEGVIAGTKTLALKPQTYMNNSGTSVSAAARFYKIPLERVFVIYDEIDLTPGKMRVKRGGGAGGHNGIRSIDAHAGKDYWRIRMGVGHPGDKNLVHGYVLSDFTKAEAPRMATFCEAVAEYLPLMLEGDDGAFMSKVAQAMNPPRPKPERKNGAPENKDGEPGDGL